MNVDENKEKNNYSNQNQFELIKTNGNCTLNYYNWAKKRMQKRTELQKIITDFEFKEKIKDQFKIKKKNFLKSKYRT